jgi:hypothetical protein
METDEYQQGTTQVQRGNDEVLLMKKIPFCTKYRKFEFSARCFPPKKSRARPSFSRVTIEQGIKGLIFLSVTRSQLLNTRFLFTADCLIFSAFVSLLRTMPVTEFNVGMTW